MKYIQLITINSEHSKYTIINKHTQKLFNTIETFVSVTFNIITLYSIKIANYLHNTFFELKRFAVFIWQSLTTFGWEELSYWWKEHCKISFGIFIHIYWSQKYITVHLWFEIPRLICKYCHSRERLTKSVSVSDCACSSLIW